MIEDQHTAGDGKPTGLGPTPAALVRTPRLDPAAAFVVDVEGRVQEVRLRSRTATALRLDPLPATVDPELQLAADVGCQLLVAMPDSRWLLGIVGAADGGELVVHLAAARPPH